MSELQWDIRNARRACGKDEAWQRCELLPEKFEMIQGQLCPSDEEGEGLLGLMRELIGADRDVRLGRLDVWRAAVAKLRD